MYRYILVHLIKEKEEKKRLTVRVLVNQSSTSKQLPSLRLVLAQSAGSLQYFLAQGEVSSYVSLWAFLPSFKG
jgi:hypothetical protein